MKNVSRGQRRITKRAIPTNCKEITDMKTTANWLRVLLGCAALAAVSWGMPTQARAQLADHETPVFADPIAGAWNCSIPPAGGAPGFTDIKNIHVGGTQSEIDNAAPPSQESPTVGTWTKTGHLTYSQKAYQMSWDSNGNFLGLWHYIGPMTLSPSRDQLSIEGTATLVDGNGNLVTSFPFTASCTRL